MLEENENMLEELLVKLNCVEEENKNLKKEIKCIKNSIRYKLGRDVARALHPSKYTVMLPVCLSRYTIQFIKKKIVKKIMPKSNINIDNNKIKENEIKKLSLSQNEQLRNLEETFNVSPYEDKLKIAKKLYRKYKTLGEITKGKVILENIITIQPESSFYRRELDMVEDKLKELKWIKKDVTKCKYTVLQPMKTNKVLHILNSSIPYHKNGYGIRSKYIVEMQKNVGINPVVITRPGFPNDFKQNSLDTDQNLIVEEVEGVKYYRCFPQQFLRYTPISQYIDMYKKQILEVIEIEKPGVVHAASNYINGLAGLKAAREKKIPFIYEIRGFWELTTVSNIPEFKNSEEYELQKSMETYVAKCADKVIVISEGLKTELIKRGIESEKIEIVPNGVDCNQFYKKPYNMKIASRLNLENNFIIGYIGSIVKYEGLQSVIQALAILRDRGIDNVKCIIVGEGKYKEQLKDLTKNLKLENRVVFTGRIEHNEVISYYSVFDLCIFAREDEEVTQMVTPLKPLEAMACGKCVMGSNLEAIKEIIKDGVNGKIYNNNNIEGLASSIECFISDKDRVRFYQNKAREWVVKNRDWNVIVKKYKEIYQISD